MTPAPTLMTVEDYFTRTPETLKPMELVYGRLRVADAPTPRHQQAVFRLALALNAHVAERGLGQVWVAPLDVVLDDSRALILQPDLFYISNDRAAIVRDRVRGAPDLVVEVLSPHPRIGETDERVRWFIEYGVSECWLVHQNQRSVRVIRATPPAYGRANGVASQRDFLRGARIESGVLPDFALSLDDVLE
jgi:Uma2 family endonuclease